MEMSLLIKRKAANRKASNRRDTNRNLSIAGRANGTKRASESVSNRFSKPKLSGKQSLRKGPSFLGKKSKVNNIVTHTTSFVSLLRRKTAPGIATEDSSCELSVAAALTAPDGHYSRVGLKKADNKIWFHEGWQKFLERYSFCVGYHLNIPTAFGHHLWDAAFGLVPRLKSQGGSFLVETEKLMALVHML